jgi:hypothetical protein
MIKWDGPAPWETDEHEMSAAGFSLDKIPHAEFDEHIWADGLLLWWHKHHELPTSDQLAADMFDEWDDPVSVEEAQKILDYLTGETHE